MRFYAPVAQPPLCGAGWIEHPDLSGRFGVRIPAGVQKLMVEGRCLPRWIHF